LFEIGIISVLIFVPAVVIVVTAARGIRLISL